MYPRPPQQVRGDQLLEQFSYFAQSQRSFEVYDLIRLEIDEVFLPSGGAYVKLNKLSMHRDALLKRKKSIIHTADFMNTDEKICLPIAIVLGIFHRVRAVMPPKRKIREFKRFRSIIRAEAQRLSASAGVDFNTMVGFSGLHEFGIFQRKLSNFNFSSDDGSIRKKKMFPINNLRDFAESYIPG